MPQCTCSGVITGCFVKVPPVRQGEVIGSLTPCEKYPTWTVLTSDNSAGVPEHMQTSHPEENMLWAMSLFFLDQWYTNHGSGPTGGS